MRRAVLVGLVVAAAFPSTAGATGGRWGLNAAGDPLLRAPVSEPYPGAGQAQWWVCAPGSPCRPVELDRFEPGDTAAGTVIESNTYAAPYSTELSPTWQGRVAASTPPALPAMPIAGATVRATPGVWAGGWGDELSDWRVIACPTPAPSGCAVLGDPAGQTTAGMGERVVEAKYVGWHLYAVEYRSAADRDPKAELVPPPSPGAPTTLPAASALVSVSAAVGPVLPAAPVATLRARALRTGDGLSLGTITCPRRCAVALTVSDSHRTVRRTLPAGPGTTRLAISRRTRLHGASLKVTVTVDGHRVAAGRLRR